MCDENSFCEQHTCIEDFAGNCQWGHIEFWADYCGKLGVVWFGGAWCMVPELKFATCPTIEELIPHIEDHDGYWWHDRARYFKAIEDYYNSLNPKELVENSATV